MIRTAMLLGVLATGLGGCKTLSTPGWVKERQGTVYLVVKTTPSGATISFPDGTVCESPCRVGVSEPLQMRVARTGYHPVEMQITRRSPSPMVIEMKPVLQDDGIEEIDVPDL